MSTGSSSVVLPSLDKPAQDQPSMVLLPRPRMNCRNRFPSGLSPTSRCTISSDTLLDGDHFEKLGLKYFHLVKLGRSSNH